MYTFHFILSVANHFYILGVRDHGPAPKVAAGASPEALEPSPASQNFAFPIILDMGYMDAQELHQAHKHIKSAFKHIKMDINHHKSMKQ